jgi:hypothetical protein
MGRYAVVVSDSGYLHGVNALLNGLKYYGNKVDFHHLYWGPEAEVWSRSAQRCGEFNVVSVDLQELAKDPDYPKRNGRMSAAWYCKFYRYFYCALALCSSAYYDAVCIMDADIMVVNNIMPWLI